MKRLFKYIWNYKLYVIIPSIAMLISIAADMVNPYIQKELVDKVFISKNFKILPVLLCSILVIAALKAFFGYIKEYVADYLSAIVTVDLRRDLFNHIEDLPFSYFDSMNTGELMSRTGEDIDIIWQTISFGLRLLIENGAYFAIITIILFSYNAKLALLTTLITAPITFLAMKMEKSIDKTYSKISDQTAVINTTAQENISGVRLVKAFAREKHEILKFLKLNDRNYELHINQTNIMADYFPAIEFLTNLSAVCVICIGGIFVVQKQMTLGSLVAFAGYIWMLAPSMKAIGRLTNIIAQCDASANKIFHIMDIKPDIKDRKNAIHPNIKGNIEFKNVSFSYNKGEEVLHDINFSVRPGETVAIMGATGSGKTSLVSLIGRFYDAENGSITIDGMDVKDISLHDLRKSMAVVSQDTFLFSDTVKENVRMGNYNASFEDIKNACSLACCNDFIENLEDGYDTIVGERGIGLSGGQKQRISIARALIKNAKILVLDDATSALDMETEYDFLKNLKRLNGSITTFIIAHRISAVKNADKILFMDHGKIVESGTHQELLEKKCRYYEIYCTQFKDFDSLESEVV